MSGRTQCTGRRHSRLACLSVWKRDSLLGCPGCAAAGADAATVHSRTGDGKQVMTKVEQWLDHPDLMAVVDPDEGALPRLEL